MQTYLDRRHDHRGMPTDYRNRVDLDTALKERGMDGLYGKTQRGLEQKELHRFLTKKALEVGEDKAKRAALAGKLFNKKDIRKV